MNKWLDERMKHEGISGGPVVKDPPANAGEMASTPGLGRFPYLGAAKPMRHSYRAWVA